MPVRAGIVVAFGLACAGCSGGMGSRTAGPAVVVSTAAPGRVLAPVTLSFVVARPVSNALRRPSFVPPSANAVVVASSLGPSATQSFSTKSPACTPSGGAYACALQFALPAGAQTLTITFNSGATALASATVGATLVADQLNVLPPVQSLGIVTAATLAVASATVAYNVPTVLTLASASDAAADAVTGTSRSRSCSHRWPARRCRSAVRSLRARAHRRASTQR